MELASLPILLLAVCSVLLAVGLVVVGKLFGPWRAGRVKEMPYESGMDPVHDTRRRFDVRFHLVAITFLVFDVELLFLYPWAVAASRKPASTFDASSADAAGIDAAIGAGLVEGRDLVFWGVMVFLALVVVGFIYDWRKGVFRWR